jgi:RNA 2',3'-cyclic 3'-phosphodiesterase
MSEESIRLFVAVPVPAEVRQALAAAQNRLRERLPEKAIGWTRPEQFHLTLKFLGAVKVGDVPALVQALQTASAAFDNLKLRCSGAGFFPTPKRPRVIWVGLEDATSQLGSLQGSVETAVAPFTLEKPENRFHAHVTLGRVKTAGRENIDQMHEWAFRESGRIYGEWIANSIELVRSRLSPNGATHVVLHLVALPGRAET